MSRAVHLQRVLIGCLLALPVMAAEPARNLLVELRWVDASVSGAALAGVRDGSVVVGTAGSVAPKPLITLSTRRPDDDVSGQAQRLLVLNGKSASVGLTEQTPVQWLDHALDMPAGQPGRTRVIAAPRTGTVERTRGFVVTPSWPGGTQPVRVEVKATRPQGEGGQTQVFSTVQVALGDWITVARSGEALRPPERGVTSSRDAEAQPSRELQLRVSLAP